MSIATLDEPRQAVGLFDSARWLILPGVALAVHRDHLRACECGCRKFLAVSNGPGTADTRVVCSSCYERREYRLKRDGDIKFATLDAQAGELILTRDPPKFRQRQSTLSPNPRSK